MKITNSFEIDQPVDRVWEFFDDVPLVAACVPGANLTDKVGDDHYQGDVVISAGPVKLEFSGELKIKSRDEAKKTLVLDGVGADKKGRGNAATTLDVSLTPMGGAATKVNIAMDLQISGAAAQYGRGLVQDVTGVLIDQTAGSMKVRMQALAQGQDPYAVGGPQAASGIAIGFTAFMRAVKRVFGRFFLPYQPAPSR